jgi:hypothetical protein
VTVQVYDSKLPKVLLGSLYQGTQKQLYVTTYLCLHSTLIPAAPIVIVVVRSSWPCASNRSWRHRATVQFVPAATGSASTYITNCARLSDMPHDKVTKYYISVSNPGSFLLNLETLHLPTDRLCLIDVDTSTWICSAVWASNADTLLF